MNLCIVCQTNEVNPMIGTPEGTGKSFCSRICQKLWLRDDLKYLDDESMKRLALNQLNKIK